MMRLEISSDFRFAVIIGSIRSLNSETMSYVVLGVEDCSRGSTLRLAHSPKATPVPKHWGPFTQEFRKHTTLQVICREDRVLGTVHEDVLLHRMTMEVQECKYLKTVDSWWYILIFFKELLQSVNGWVEHLIGVPELAVQVSPSDTCTIIAHYHTIRVDHWHDLQLCPTKHM